MPAPRSPAARVPILFVHWGDEGIRGSERVLLDLLTQLDRNAFAPRVWCNAQAMKEAVRALDVPVNVNRMPILLGWDAPKFDVRAYRGLVREGIGIASEHGARVIHANSGAPNQWMVPVARRARLPLVSHLHAVYGLRERCTLLLHQTPMLVGCSGAVVNPFSNDGMPSSRLRVIHNGIDVERLDTGDARDLRRSLGIADDATVIASAGALHRMKGYDVLLGALANLRARDVNVHLVIAGEGPERGDLELLTRDLGVSDRVHFLGQRRDVGAIFRDAADVLAASSRVESFGLTILEAAAFGRPAVVTSVGGLPEVVQQNVTGFVVPPDDSQAFADALARLVADAELRRRMGSAARARARSSFTVQTMTREFESLYDEMLSRPSLAYGDKTLRYRVAPFARLGYEMVARRLGLRVQPS